MIMNSKFNKKIWIYNHNKMYKITKSLKIRNNKINNLCNFKII